MRTAILALVATLLCPASSKADCVHQAAAYHAVNPYILRAIGWHESRLRPSALARNRNGSVDIGAFQINSMHLARLARFGIDARSLQDGCVSAYVAAWHYRQQMNRFGDSWQAVGAYHSHTPARAAWYANAIAGVLMRWGVTAPGPPPYPAALTLAPNQNNPAREHATTRRTVAASSPITVLDSSGDAFSAHHTAPPDKSPP